MTAAPRRALRIAPVPRVLFDGAHLQVLHIPGGSPFGLVTFHVMHAKADGRNAFGSRLALRHDYALWGVVPKAPNWYPAVEMEAAAAVIRATLDRPALAYGASMGGYAALRYGAQAGCAAALAFSPQATIDPALTGGGDARYHRYHDADLHADMAVQAHHLTPNSFAIIDPDVAPDLAQASLLPRAVTMVTLGMMGHKTAGAIASSSVARGVFEAALTGRRDVIARLLGRNKKNAPIYHANLTLALIASGRPAWALDVARAGQARFDRNEELSLALADALAANGYRSEATAMVRDLVDRFPAVARYRGALLRHLADAGQDDAYLAEVVALADAIPVFPLHLKAIKALLRAGRHEAAAARHAIAAARWPEQAAALPTVGP